jgi:uncharacterized protein (DUF58 family)
VELPVLPTSQNASAVSVEIRAGAHEEQRAVLSLEGEHMALRPYVAGDRLHRLHWPALARNGELLIRDTEGVRSGAGKVVVLLDVRRTVHDRYSLDRAVELAAGVAVFAFERDLAVAIVTTAGDALTVEPGHDATRDMLRWLAGVGPGPAGVSTSTPGNASGISHSRRVATPRVVVTSPRGAQNLPAEMRGLLVTR